MFLAKRCVSGGRKCRLPNQAMEQNRNSVVEDGEVVGSGCSLFRCAHEDSTLRTVNVVFNPLKESSFVRHE
jgi:hypothetical protein